MKVFLTVPYKDKDEAKRMGAKWCQEQKKWYTTEKSRDCNELLKRWKKNESATEYLNKSIKKENTGIKSRIQSDISEKPRFSASDVASLIGKNPYKTRDETLLKTLQMIPKFKDIILRVKKDTGTKSEKEIIKDATPEIQLVLKESIKMAIISNSEKVIDQTIQSFKEKLLLTIVENTLLGERETKSMEIKDAIFRVNTGETTIKEECTTLLLDKKVIDSIEKTKEVEVLVSQIQKQRGIQLEKVVEDKYTIKTSNSVLERNTFTKYECNEYKLIGYIDGMVEDKVMETKNRKRFWKEPPLYDIIQLRCYMFMKGKVDGILYENFPEEEPRETFLLWDENEWDLIHDNLCDVVNFIHNLSLTDVEKITYDVLSL